MQQWRDVDQSHIDTLIAERQMYENAASQAIVENRKYAAVQYRDMVLAITRRIHNEQQKASESETE
jgi:hypothetical protein